MKGEPSARPTLLFEGVTREDADKNVILLIKYLFNYAFYKFGIEATLVSMAILICLRKDLVSFVYIIWLCAIICLQRQRKQFIWPVFQYFVAITIVIQYAIMLNLPSFLQSHKDSGRQFLSLFIHSIKFDFIFFCFSIHLQHFNGNLKSLSLPKVWYHWKKNQESFCWISSYWYASAVSEMYLPLRKSLAEKSTRADEMSHPLKTLVLLFLVKFRFERMIFSTPPIGWTF